MGRKTQLPFNFAGVYRVTPVMASAIFYKLNQGMGFTMHGG